MTNEEGEARYKYDLNVRGVFGRNRTSKFQCKTFHEVKVEDALSDSDAVAKGIEALDSVKLKKGSWTITRRFVKVEHRDGFVITKFALMEYDTLASGSC